MKILISTLASLLFLLPTVRATTETKDALAQEIVALIGVEEMVRGAKEASLKQTKEALAQMIDQVRSGFPQLPKESSDAIHVAALKMIKSVENSWNPEEAINIWKREYTADFTDDELRSILAALKTPLGQKQIVANKKAGAVLQDYLRTRAKAAVEEAMKEYLADLQKIVAPKTE